MKIIDIADELPRHKTKQYRTRKASQIRQIIIHHSATKPNSIDGRRDAQAFAEHHISVRGWPGIGYDYVIGLDGTVWKTNRNDAVNYHAGNANALSLGICLAGTFNVQSPPPAQWQAAVNLTQQLMAAYGISAERVLGHREVPGANTDCPGWYFNMNRFRQEASERRDTT